MKTLRIAIIGFVAVALAGMARGATLYWDANGTLPVNAGSGNWNTTSNFWYNGSSYQAWVNNNNVDLSSAGGGTLTLTENITVGDNSIARMIRVDNWGNIINNVEGSTTSGKTLTLDATGGIGASRIAIGGDNAGFLITINCPVILAGAIGTPAHEIKTYAVINGNISESSAGRILQMAHINSTAELNGNNSFSGGLILGAQPVLLGHDNAAGTGPISFGGGAIGAANGDRVINNVLNEQDAWDNYLGVVGTNKITFMQEYETRSAFGAGGRVDVAAGAQVDFKNFKMINNSGIGFQKQGAGTMILSGIFTQSAAGPFTVVSGTLLVNTTSPSLGDVTVANTGTLGGTGTITLASGKSVTVTNGASLAPGNAGVGTLTITNGPLNFAENAVYRWEYQNGAGDLVQVYGDIVLPSVATVNVTQISGALPSPATIFSATSLSGASDLSGWVLNGDVDAAAVAQISGTDVVIIDIPPPAGTLITIK